MKTPIEYDAIRAGDTVEREWLGTILRMPVARVHQGLLYSPEEYCAADCDDSTWSLIDRPKPPVDLPTEPTLGWANFGGSDTCLSIWSEQMRPVCQCGSSAGGDPEKLESFVAATAVPTSALDELRLVTRSAWEGAPSRVFLAAVDKAGDPR